MNFRLKALVSLAAPLACCVALAAPITPDGAFRAAENWRGGARRHLGKPAGAPTGRMRTFSEDGTNLFHLVELEGGGFVAVAADDLRPPVMAFSPSGELPEEDDGGPLWAMLAADGAAAVDAAAGKGNGGGKSHRRKRHSRRRLSMSEHQASPSARAAGKVQRSTASSSLSSISDVRVAPLVESKWDQKAAGGKYTYNYHTPNHWYCGCVATAMAQLMRFHKFPTASVTPQTFTCWIGVTATTLTMIGGTYDWDSMPFVPTSSTTDAEREMIGRLCYDAGVSMRMQYGSGGSGAFAPFSHDPFVNVFGYANAESYFTTNAITDAEIKNAILANLDAGYPVLVGINDNSGDSGHAILADGYGYEDNTLWCHINMGWSGNNDIWYALPYIPAGSYIFTVVNSITYNVFPTGTGQLVTGRVTDQNGNPIEGASVSAVSGMNSFSTNVTTSATGIYSVRIPMSGRKNRSVTLTASYGSTTSNSKSTMITASSSPVDMDWDAGIFYYEEPGLSIGNSWGNDLTINVPTAETPTITAFTAAKDGGTEGFSLSFSGTGNAQYEVQSTTNLINAIWSPCTNLVLAPSGSTTIFLPMGDGPSCFWRVIPKE